MKNIFSLLILIILITTSFTTSPISPIEKNGEILLNDLLNNDSESFKKKYQIDSSDLQWYENKINSDTLLTDETKLEYIDNFKEFKLKNNNSQEIRYTRKWTSLLEKYNIKKSDIKYIKTYYIQTNQNFHINGLGVFIKFFANNSYYYVQLSVYEINKKWKGALLSNSDECDKYFDGI
ncbi:hypothetical protein [Cytophaga aurantiaca]|uniref:hypothetical protein n=1 Tax=Cytophaga aurantiaca TaxID=29530 RepID=UPI00037F4AD7|nr:hypothetical protein [Cytophaga aurantiaca]